jgi:secretion/DNA translocation related TadE-like protein
MTASRATQERGAVSIIVIAVLLVALGGMVAAARAGVVLVGEARADTAADAAALAAADVLALGKGRPEPAARDAASRNGARLVSCDCRDTHAEVVVEVKLRGGSASKVRARARAEVRPECGPIGGCGDDVSKR